ncbi:hypothetical protein BASA81_002654 [Batrachochytrium salamandrivorans]|nr:hypothetical protein BASA81_002654 [Batrachochytrium salamandrivorans]
MSLPFLQFNAQGYFKGGRPFTIDNNDSSDPNHITANSKRIWDEFEENYLHTDKKIVNLYFGKTTVWRGNLETDFIKRFRDHQLHFEKHPYARGGHLEFVVLYVSESEGLWNHEDLALKYEELFIISRRDAYEAFGSDLDEQERSRRFDYDQGNGGGGCASNKPLSEARSLVYARIQIGGVGPVPEKKSKRAESG